MPTYSYRCTECGNAFDIHQAFTDDALTVCDVCGGRLRKLFNTIGVTFNGSGFYRTDSRGEGGKGGAGGSGGSSGSDASSGGSSSSSSSGSSDSSSSSSSSSGGGSSSGSTSSGSSASVA
ncbi:FmdB family zinc ribbon protein [Agromyces sp. NPDC057865]|uniref:FmdB family zinc ribbon protein n=1 Tax=Agromyces sp. NPDC057865 TaxID=3346267 RepID=UPI00366E73A1